MGPDGGARRRTKAAKESATPETKDSTLKPEKEKKRKRTPLKVAFNSYLSILLNLFEFYLLSYVFFTCLFVHRS